MNTQERKAALQNIYTLSGYYNSISGVLGIDQWGGLPDEAENASGDEKRGGDGGRFQ